MSNAAAAVVAGIDIARAHLDIDVHPGGGRPWRVPYTEAGLADLVAQLRRHRVALYQRLRAAGKRTKVALTACVRTFVIILNAMVKTGRPWQPVRSRP